MKGKRGTDHTWILIKIVGDGAIYAQCKCGYEYNCGRGKKEPDGSFRLKQEPSVFY